MALEPNDGQTNPVGRIYLTWGRICLTRTATTVLEPDEDNRSGRIYPTR
jgi:hypothetical protein